MIQGGPFQISLYMEIGEGVLGNQSTVDTWWSFSNIFIRGDRRGIGPWCKKGAFCSLFPNTAKVASVAKDVHSVICC